MAEKEVLETDLNRPVPHPDKTAGYNPPPETPNQPTKHQVPPPRKKDE